MPLKFTGNPYPVAGCGPGSAPKPALTPAELRIAQPLGPCIQTGRRPSYLPIRYLLRLTVLSPDGVYLLPRPCLVMVHTQAGRQQVALASVTVWSLVSIDGSPDRLFRKAKEF